VRSSVQDKPRVASCKVLSSAPDLIRSNGMGSSGRGVDAVTEGDDLEEPLLDQLDDTVTQLDGRRLRGGIVLEPVEMEMELLDLIVVIGLEAGRGRG